ncbi:MAG: ECF-type sigma factor, partial [Planctomyces sp.]
VDSEDLAHSAFRRCCVALMAGRYGELNDREDLWNLLIVYTLNRVRRHFRDSTAQKRQLERGELVELSGELALYDLRQPETATVMSDLLAYWMERLDAEDPSGELRTIALMRMEHRTADEIARALQRRKTIVLQKIQLIRLIWEQCEQL